MNVATQINKELLAEIAAEAIAKVQASNSKDAQRWINAINKAVTEIETNPYLTFDAKKSELLILSQSSGQVYSANGICQCRAYEQKQACYYRAMSRLVAIYVARTAQPVKAARTDDPVYFQPAEKKAQRIGGIRL